MMKIDQEPCKSFLSLDIFVRLTRPRRVGINMYTIKKLLKVMFSSEPLGREQNNLKKCKELGTA